MPLRERQKEMTYREIKRVGQRLFYEQDYDDVQVDEIAKQTGISRGTFYLHFANKNELLVSILFDALEAQLECYRLLTSIQKIDLKALRVWLDEFRGSFDERRGSMELFPRVFDQAGGEVVVKHRDRAIAILGERFPAFNLKRLSKKQAERRRALAYILLFELEQVVFTFSTNVGAPNIDLGLDILAERLLAFIHQDNDEVKKTPAKKR